MCARELECRQSWPLIETGPARPPEMAKLKRPLKLRHLRSIEPPDEVQRCQEFVYPVGGRVVWQRCEMAAIVRAPSGLRVCPFHAVTVSRSNCAPVA